LNKPYNFILYQLSVGLGDGVTAMIFNIAFGGLTVWLLVGPPPSAGGWLLTLVAVILSWLIDFCFSAMIGLAAFIAEEVNAFEWIYQKTIFLFGGLLIPLDFFPAWLQKIAFSLPFASIIYGPARLFVDPTLERFLSLVLMQLAWLLVSALGLVVLFQRGVRRLVINGG
jgi:ABC-2 type transport system permease protein